MSNDDKDQSTEELQTEAKLVSRRNFLIGLRKWSAIVIGSALVGGVLLPEETAGWVNSRGSWVNGRAGGWVNRGGSWINGGGSWVNRGGGGAWVNGGRAWVNGGGGSAWVNRRGL
jgi:hypothetical protein